MRQSDPVLGVSHMKGAGDPYRVTQARQDLDLFSSGNFRSRMFIYRERHRFLSGIEHYDTLG